eukprot:9475165-Pyramimonas_sp.AAC.1
MADARWEFPWLPGPGVLTEWFLVQCPHRIFSAEAIEEHLGSSCEAEKTRKVHQYTGSPSDGK